MPSFAAKKLLIFNCLTLSHPPHELQTIIPSGAFALYSGPHLQHLFPMIGKSKGLYLSAGLLLTALAAVGLLLPLLPTTPLLLLAAGCFARSSEKCHYWLTEHKTFGPVIRNWHENKCIPKKSKMIAVASILIFGTYSIGFAIQRPVIQIMGGILLLTGLVFVLKIPVCGKK